MLIIIFRETNIYNLFHEVKVSFLPVATRGGPGTTVRLTLCHERLLSLLPKEIAGGVFPVLLRGREVGERLTWLVHQAGREPA